MRSNIHRTFILSTIVAALGSSFDASALPEFPGSQYSASVPDTQQVLGYKLGSRISEPAAIRHGDRRPGGVHAADAGGHSCALFFFV